MQRVIRQRMEREIARFNLICESALSYCPLRPSVRRHFRVNGSERSCRWPWRAPSPRFPPLLGTCSQETERLKRTGGREGEETADIAEEVAFVTSSRLICYWNTPSASLYRLHLYSTHDATGIGNSTNPRFREYDYKKLRSSA